MENIPISFHPIKFYLLIYDNYLINLLVTPASFITFIQLLSFIRVFIQSY